MTGVLLLSDGPSDEQGRPVAVADDTWGTLSQHLDDRRLIEFTLLVTQYDGLATTIGTLRVQRDFS